MAADAAHTSAPEEVVDPVCGEVFPPELAVFSSTHAGQRVYFCSSTCKETFDAEPEAHPPRDPPEA